VEGLQMCYKITLALVVVSLVLIAPISVGCQQPEPTMMLYGYVFIRTVAGQNMTAPEGLKVYAKTNSTTISNDTTQEEGKYTLPVTGPQEDEFFDIYVQGIPVTTVQYHSWNVTWLNLTVIDSFAPTVEILSPTPGTTLFQTPVWINVTILDNLAVDASSTEVRMNESTVVGTFDPATSLLACKVEVATSGLYFIEAVAADLAQNTTTKSWNFTLLIPQPPMVNIIYPTTENPAYTRSGQNVPITFNYTEPYPKNVTIAIHNGTVTVAKLDITPLENMYAERTERALINEGALDGKYTVSVTVFNSFNLSTQADEVESVIVDNTPPTIEQVRQDPPVDSVQPSDAVRVNATIKDTLSGVFNATLFWRAEEGQWTTAPMSRISGDIYSATIPPFENFTNVYYKIESYDNLGNRAVEDNAGQFHAYRVIPEYSIAVLALLLFACTSVFVILRKQARGQKQRRCGRIAT
jgi:hypothetical protein